MQFCFGPPSHSPIPRVLLVQGQLKFWSDMVKQKSNPWLASGFVWWRSPPCGNTGSCVISRGCVLLFLLVSSDKWRCWRGKELPLLLGCLGILARKTKVVFCVGWQVLIIPDSLLTSNLSMQAFVSSDRFFGLWLHNKPGTCQDSWQPSPS